MLQLHDIGAMEVGEAQVERSIAELIRGVYQTAPALSVHMGAASSDSLRRNSATAAEVAGPNCLASSSVASME